MPITRRAILTYSLTSLALPAIGKAAGAWPEHQIELVVPLTAGGPTDLLARILAKPLGQSLGQSIVILNRPGAGGDIGAEYVAKARPDGYTLFLGTSGPLSINATLYGNLPFDPITDFAPISMAASAPFVVVVNTKSSFKTFQDLVAYAKAHPGKLNYGVVPGSAAHLATELCKMKAGIDIRQVPYKGAAPATTDLLAGQIDLSFASTPGVVGLIKSGKLRALGTTSKTRLQQLPDVPTLAESGLPGYEASVWYGLLGPAHLPDDIVRRLNKEMTKALTDKAVIDQMVANYFDPETSTPQQFAAFIKSESDKWGDVVRKSGAKVG
ncbi:MAG TPA: tripartite tricarboxylate transporter substrate binding protein [Bordetella sp.]|jgi:tripartite-type tricarboxylate transporter receptor subunit TctC|nr:tripartite tricarboxylate transporter substrate binding protein [Bordetella sp.]